MCWKQLVLHLATTTPKSEHLILVWLIRECFVPEHFANGILGLWMAGAQCQSCSWSGRHARLGRWLYSRSARCPEVISKWHGQILLNINPGICMGNDSLQQLFFTWNHLLVRLIELLRPKENKHVHQSTWTCVFGWDLRLETDSGAKSISCLPQRMHACPPFDLQSYWACSCQATIVLLITFEVEVPSPERRIFTWQRRAISLASSWSLALSVPVLSFVASTRRLEIASTYPCMTASALLV